MSEPEILFDIVEGVGRIVLNRPKALNALSLAKIGEMDRTLRGWADDPGVKAVIIEGAGNKAFCAGGDIRVLSDAARAGDDATIRQFFRAEYTLDRLIKTFPKPYLAFLNGITMGGGVGISVHGSHRIATENTLFAMPETGIGMIPDVGGTWFLPRCPGAVGLYLGLTGQRLKAADCLYAGIATHIVPAERLGDLEAGLCEAARRADDADRMWQAITDVLDVFHEDDEAPPLETHRAAIDAAFGQDSVESILSALDGMDTEWSAQTAATLRGKSPTALKVAFRQLRAGLQLDFDQAMQMEFRLATRITRTPDFSEGVRAAIIDKDNAPRWSPDTLEDVDDDQVRAFFAPLGDGDELAFE
ncbi:enoyl-CoA hydratase/isomerase family protein [uncultured Rhodospira sp.]|uniref:enoyl-CoA hydratase/isomerase family protein n=1 Tax=uncultured Rhodospira sp. TaxID=1936189 RepID=UPI002619C2B1|nr:enoyl-CoA hydratase/isomerase family protein [uncultured Rhodospira sp.]